MRAKPSCRCSFITDVKSVGLKAMQGLTFITAFYWDRDDESQAWSRRFFELHKRMPTMAHAAIYSAVRHCLRAIEAAGTDQAKAVMAKMREIPVFTPRTGGYAKTAAWCTTCTSCRSKRRRNRTARGATTRSCRPFRAIKPFVPWTKADVRWSNSDRRLCRQHWCPPILDEGGNSPCRT